MSFPTLRKVKSRDERAERKAQLWSPGTTKYSMNDDRNGATSARTTPWLVTIGQWVKGNKGKGSAPPAVPMPHGPRTRRVRRKKNKVEALDVRDVADRGVAGDELVYPVNDSAEG